MPNLSLGSNTLPDFSVGFCVNVFVLGCMYVHLCEAPGIYGHVCVCECVCVYVCTCLLMLVGSRLENVHAQIQPGLSLLS